MLAGLALGTVLLLLAVLSPNAFNWTFFHPTSPNLTLVFAGISALIFLLLIALLFVLLRNLLKLYSERRIGKLGSQFRTRMVVGALALSLVPVICLFLFAYELIGHSLDKWFALPVEELHSNSGKVASLLSGYALKNAEAEAQEVAGLPEAQQLAQAGNPSALLQQLQRREQTLQGGFALVLSGADLTAAYDAPAAWPELRSKMPSLRLLDEHPSQAFSMDHADYVLGSAKFGSDGRIIIVMPLPAGLRATQEQIDASTSNYYQLSKERLALRRFYMGVLSLIAVLVLFAATWLALFLSKLVTRPVE